MIVRRRRDGDRPAAGRKASAPPAVAGLDAGFWLIVLYLFVEYARPQNLIPAFAAIRPGLLVQGLLLLLFLFRLPVRLPTQLKLIIVFLLLMAKSVPFAYNRYYAFLTMQDMTISFCCVWLPMAVFLGSVARLRVLFQSWVAIHFFLALHAMKSGGTGVGGFLGDENDICAALVIALPFAYFLFLGSRSPLGRVLLLLGMAVLLVGVMVTKSRGGFVALAAVGLFCWFFTPRKLAATAAVLVAVLLMALFAPPDYWQEVESIGSSYKADDTGGKRLYYWKLGLLMFRDRPIMGWGPSNFSWAAYTYQTLEESSGIGQRALYGKAAHSMYFQLLPELGIPGVLVFLALIIISVRQLVEIIRRRPPPAERPAYPSRARPPAPRPAGVPLEELESLATLSLAALGALIGCLVSGLFISILYYPHFWILVVLASMIHRCFRDRVPESFGARGRRARPGLRIGAPAEGTAS